MDHSAEIGIHMTVHAGFRGVSRAYIALSDENIFWQEIGGEKILVDPLSELQAKVM